MRARDNRLARLRHAIDASPVRSGILNEAYEWFTMFGELPDDDHVAYEVVQQALRDGKEAPLADEAALGDQVRSARLAYHQRQRPGESWPPSVRALLFDEALFEPEPLRSVARAAIAAEVAWGGDVENQAFAARHGIPGYGSVALHVSDAPGRLAIPPYEDQALRLLVRRDNLRGRIPQDDPQWFEALAEAMVAFWRSGKLPDDDLQLELVLADAEFDLLRAHKRGCDVSQAMKLLDQATQSEGDELERCLATISDLAKARLLTAGDR